MGRWGGNAGTGSSLRKVHAGEPAAGGLVTPLFGAAPNGAEFLQALALSALRRPSH